MSDACAIEAASTGHRTPCPPIGPQALATVAIPDGLPKEAALSSGVSTVPVALRSYETLEGHGGRDEVPPSAADANANRLLEPVELVSKFPLR